MSSAFLMSDFSATTELRAMRVRLSAEIAVLMAVKTGEGPGQMRASERAAGIADLRLKMDALDVAIKRIARHPAK